MFCFINLQQSLTSTPSILEISFHLTRLFQAENLKQFFFAQKIAHFKERNNFSNRLVELREIKLGLWIHVRMLKVKGNKNTESYKKLLIFFSSGKLKIKQHGWISSGFCQRDCWWMKLRWNEEHCAWRCRRGRWTEVDCWSRSRCNGIYVTWYDCGLQSVRFIEDFKIFLNEWIDITKFNKWILNLNWD